MSKITRTKCENVAKRNLTYELPLQDCVDVFSAAVNEITKAAAEDAGNI